MWLEIEIRDGMFRAIASLKFLANTTESPFEFRLSLARAYISIFQFLTGCGTRTCSKNAFRGCASWFVENLSQIYEE